MFSHTRSSSANTNQKYWTNGINGGLWLHITFLSPYRCLFANKRGHIQNRNSNAFLWLLKQKTRNKRYEQFLWQELYDEYIRQNERLFNTKSDPASTEYFDEFCKDMPAEDEAAKEALVDRYPLYYIPHYYRTVGKPVFQIGDTTFEIMGAIIRVVVACKY
ncbi:hypothetical protein GQX74_010656 [Glossina fuscipes]|nr:hypothetical protein GQX74_010656 [Glossina fuscipes]